MDRLKRILLKIQDLDLAGQIEDIEEVMKGYGGSCEVYRGKCTRLQKQVAIKRFRFFLQKEQKFAQKLTPEIYIWSKLDHPNVLPFLGFYLEKSGFPNLVSEWMENGTLFDYLPKIPRGIAALNMLLGIAEGLSYLHSMKVIHADLKSTNVLISREGTPLLGDFGVSSTLSSTLTMTGTTSYSPKGTARWMAIELLNLTHGTETPTRSEQADVWAFGMVAYEILARQVPFSHLKSDLHVMLAITKGELPTRPVASDDVEVTEIEDKLWQISERCWKSEPNARPPAVQLSVSLRSALKHSEVLTSSGEDPPVGDVLSKFPHEDEAGRISSHLGDAHLEVSEWLSLEPVISFTVKNNDRKYGLLSGPRPGNVGGGGELQTTSANGSFSRATSPNTLGRSPQGARRHAKSLSNITPSPPAKDRPVRRNTSASTSAHPYANVHSGGTLQPPAGLANNLSPISEGFGSQHTGGSGGSNTSGGTASSAYAIGRRPFSVAPLQVPSLDDLRRRLIKFNYADNGHSVTINTRDCQDGIEVLERALRKFGKIGNNSKEDEPYDYEISFEGGLSIDGWSVYFDWGGDEGPDKALREAELLAVCSTGPDHPVRKYGLTIRRSDKSKRTKALQAIFGEQTPAPVVGISTSGSPGGTITNALIQNDSGSSQSLMFASNPNLSGDEDKVDENAAGASATSLGPYGPIGVAKSVQDREQRNMKRASSIGVMSGPGVRDHERILQSSTNSSSTNSSTTQRSKKQANAKAKTLTASTFAGKIRTFLGQRPPSELIATHLPAYFPHTQPKVLRKTLRQSVRLSNMIAGGERDSVTDEPKTYIDTEEEFIAAGDVEEETDGREDDNSDTFDDDDDYDVVDEETPANADDDESVKAAGGKRGIKWIKGELIGSGSFGQVYLGMDAMNGLLMAVKQVPLPSGSGPNEARKKTNLRALEREIDLLKDLQHDNIVQYLDSSSDDKHLNIFLEYVPGGSVSALLRSYGAFEETLCRHFVRQILQGLIYLHDRDIIHRNIKGANILVDNKGGIKISDFGISKKVEEIPSPLLEPQALAQKGGRNNRESFKGAVFWMAPEAVQQNSYTRKADIWSVGCLVLEMLTGERPWPNLTEYQAIFKIGSMTMKPNIPADISSEAEDFLMRTFETNIELRPSAKELLQHSWIVKDPQRTPTNSTNAKTKPDKAA